MGRKSVGKWKSGEKKIWKLQPSYIQNHGILEKKIFEWFHMKAGVMYAPSLIKISDYGLRNIKIKIGWIVMESTYFIQISR